MRIRLSKLYKMSAITLVAGICCMSASAAFAAEESVNSVDLQPSETNVSSEMKNDVKILGTTSADSLSITLTNKTGKDITYINIFEYDPEYDETVEIKRMQEALIEQGFLDDIVDGSFGPKTQAAVESFRVAKNLQADGGADTQMLTLLYGEYDDGNFLKNADTLKADETAVLYYPLLAADNTQSSTVQEVHVFHSEIKFADDDKDYTLHVLPNEKTEVSLLLKDGVLYLEYADLNTNEAISTFDDEKAEYDRENEISAQVSYDYADTYYDDGYYADDYYDESWDSGWVDDSYYSDDTYTDNGQDGCIEDGLFW